MHLTQIPTVFVVLFVGSLTSIGFGQADPPQEASDPKGAIIIASIEGEVAVTNNLSGANLPAPSVAAGKILSDGHTVKTGPNGKVILLFSTGTVTTLKPDSTLNIKKFTQGKIPAGTNLNAIKEEPSASDVLIDLNVGDMVVDIKKLKKESSFNIDSPVGTAGIRGTRVGMNIRPAAGGGWLSKITVPRGAISFTPLAILGAPPPIPVPVLAGQAVAPAVTETGAVAAAPVAAPAAAGDLAAINADLDDAGAAANNAIDNVAPAPGDGPSSDDAPEPDAEEEAPSEEELNEEDDDRQAASKGVDDQNSSSEAVALDKAGLIDLDNPEQLNQVETFVEVTDKAATMFKSKQDEVEKQRKAGRRVANEDDESLSFLNNLTKRDEEPYMKDGNGVVVLDPDGNPVPNPNYGKLPLANVVDVTESAQSVGASDSSTLTAVLDNAEMADELKVVIAAADDVGSKDKDTLGAVLRNAEQGDKLAKVVNDAKAVETSEVVESTSAVSSEKKGKTLGALFKVVKKVDAVQQEEEAKIAAALKAEAEKQAADEALKKSAQDAALAAELQAKADEEAAKIAAALKAEAEGKSAEEITAAIAAAEAKAQADAADAAKALADEASAKVDNAKVAYDQALVDIEAASNAAGIDEIVSAFEATHTSVARVGLDLSPTAFSRKDTLTTKVSTTNVFGNLDDVVTLTETATSVGSEAGFESVLENAKDADKLVTVIEAAQDITGAEDSLAAVLKSADKAVQMEQVVAADNQKKKEVQDKLEAAQAAGEDVAAIELEIKAAAEAATKKAKALLTVVKKVDTARDAQQLAAETPVDPSGEAPVVTAPAVKVDDVFNNFSAVVDLADKAGDIAGAGGDSSLLENVLNNADQANELKEMVEKSETVALEAKAKAETAALAALGDGATDAEKAAAKAAASDTIAEASLTTLFVNADKASDLKEMVEKSETVALEAKAKAETAALVALGDGATEAEKAAAKAAAADTVAEASLTTLFVNADKASDLKAMVEKSETVALEAKAKAETAALAALGDGATDAEKAAARAAASDTIAEASLTTLFVNADKASDLKEMVEKSETVALEAKAKAETAALAALGDDATDAEKAAARAAASDTVAEASLTTLFVNADKASDLKAMVEKSETVALEAKAKAETAALAALGDGATDAEKAAAKTAAADAVAAPALTNLFQNADKADDLVKVVTAAGDGADLSNVFANVDKADKLATVVTAAGEGADLTNMLANADKAEDLAKVVTAAGVGADLTSMLANADKAADLAKVVDAAGAGANLTTMLANADKAADLAKVVDAAGVGANLTTMLANADKAADLAKVVDAAGAGANLTTMLANADKAADLAKVVDAAGGETDLTIMLANADKAADLAKVITAAGDGADFTEMFANADKAADLAKVVTAAGDGADLTKVLANADKAESFAKVVDQIDTLNFEGDQAKDIFDNIDVVADVLGDVTTEGTAVNADVARNLLGNAKEAKQMQDALAVIKEASLGSDGGGAAPSLADLENIVKKDVKELEAINNVATKLKESGEGGAAALEAFVSQNIDKAAQLDQALEGNADLAGEIAAQAKAKADADAAAVAALGEGATEEEKTAAIAAAAEVDGAAGALNIDSLVDASALGSLQTDYAGTDYLSVLEKPENADKADDIAFALSFIKSGKSDLSAEEAAKETANEAAFFANIDKLDDLIDLGLKFEDDPIKMDTIFNNLDRLDALKELSEELAVYPDRIKLVFENADKADALLGTFKDVKASGSDSLMDSLFASKESLDSTMANQGLIKLTAEYPQYGDAIAQHGSKAAEIAATAEDFKDDTAKLDLIFGNLDKLDAVNDMTARYGADADKAKIDKLFENFDKLDDIKKLSDRLEGANLDAAQDRLFENIDRLDDFENGLDVFTEAGILKQLDGATAEQVEMIFDIGDAFGGDAEKLKVAGSNLDKLADLKALSEDKDLDSAKLDLVFANPDKANAIKDLNDAHGDDAGALDVVFGNLDMVDDFGKDSGLLTFAKDNPEDFKTAKDSGTASENLSSTLLNELKELGLSGEELKTVLADLNSGPAAGQQPGDAPNTQPIDPATVSLLANHEIKDNVIDLNLIFNADLALASSFFKDVAQVYDSLSDSSDSAESNSRNFRVFGGRNVSISAGSYDIGGVYGGPGKDDFLIAATDKLTIAGNTAFRNTDETMASAADGLILLSSGAISLPQGTADQHASVSYAGEMLGIGSLESLNVINVDLQAEGEVSLRSLDSLVIKNSKMMTTNGNGTDFVHLRALDEIDANHLLFSATVQKIVMDAMTINLANVTFPGGSSVNLNSALGPLDSKYPTFGSQNKAYGRVNFINDVRYGQHLLNSRSAFNTHGGSITIGTK